MSRYAIDSTGLVPFPTHDAPTVKYDTDGLVPTPGEDDITPNGFQPLEDQTHFALVVSASVAGDQPSRDVTPKRIVQTIDLRAREMTVCIDLKNETGATASMVVAVGRNRGFPLLSTRTEIEGLNFEMRAEPNERAEHTYNAAVNSDTHTATLSTCEGAQAVKTIGKVPAGAAVRVYFVFKMPVLTWMRTMDGDDVSDLGFITPPQRVHETVPFYLRLRLPFDVHALLPSEEVAKFDQEQLTAQGAQHLLWVHPRAFRDADVAHEAFDGRFAELTLPHGTMISRMLRLRVARAPLEFDAANPDCRVVGHADLGDGRCLRRICLPAPTQWSEKTNPTAKLHVLLVGDKSGSMGMRYEGVSNRDRADREIRSLLGGLPELFAKLAARGIAARDICVSLIGFHSTAAVLATRIDGADAVGLARAATDFAADVSTGGTSYLSWLEAARALVDPKERVCLALVTDGAAWDGPSFYPHYESLKKHVDGFEAVVIGFGAWLHEGTARKVQTNGYELLPKIGEGEATRAATRLLARAIGRLLLTFSVRLAEGHDFVSAVGAVRVTPAMTATMRAVDELTIHLGDTLDMVVCGPTAGSPVVLVDGKPTSPVMYAGNDPMSVLQALDAMHADGTLTPTTALRVDDLVERLGCVHSLVTSRTKIVEIAPASGLLKPKHEAAKPNNLHEAFAISPASLGIQVVDPHVETEDADMPVYRSLDGYRSLGGLTSAPAQTYRSLCSHDDAPMSTANAPTGPLPALKWIISTPFFLYDYADAVAAALKLLPDRKRKSSAIDTLVDTALDIAPQEDSSEHLRACVNILVHVALARGLCVQSRGLATLSEVEAFGRAVGRVVGRAVGRVVGRATSV